MTNDRADGAPVPTVPRWTAWLLPLTRIPWVAKLGLPVAASLALHGIIAAILITSALGFSHGSGQVRSRAEVVITLPRPVSPLARKDDPRQGEALRPAPAPAAPPRLQGLSTPSAAPPPVLRSAGADSPGVGELLRRQDESAIGGATFAGLGAKRAGSVVYVVDASGAMVSSLKFVFAELERSVGGLSSAQRFQVVLFRERPGAASLYETFTPPSVDARRLKLVAATPTNKAALSRWLASVAPFGRSNPLDGLRRGLEFEPDAIFLLSRSIRRSGNEAGKPETGGVWGRGTAEILAELDRANPRRGQHRRVIIKCIQFLEEDPTGTMQAIGTEHGDGAGSYSVLTLRQLGAQ
jgi:hypothetical protein